MVLDHAKSDRLARPTEKWYVQRLVTNEAHVEVASRVRTFVQKTQDVRQRSELTASWPVNVLEDLPRAHCHSQPRENERDNK